MHVTLLLMLWGWVEKSQGTGRGWSVQVEELRRKDAEQRDRLKSNLAVLAELQREVAHWRSRTALAAREWTEREESLASERAGMRALLSHTYLRLPLS